MSVEVRFDQRAVKASKLSRLQRAQTLLDQQIAADSNYYCPEDKGDLKKSVYLSSRMGGGLLVWGVSYAKRLYHAVNARFSKDRNPNASSKWFERARAAKAKAWEALVNREYSR